MGVRAIRVAVIGAGMMAREHLRAFADVSDVEIVGITSRTMSRARILAQEFRVSHVCDSVRTLYSEAGPDLVIIAVPEFAARAVSAECHEFPWAVLMEKPPGLNVADAASILASANRHGRRVFVGLNRRFLSSTQTVLRDLTTLTGTRFIHVQDQQSLAAAAALGHPADVVANWMFANSIHVIDYLTLFGRGSAVQVKQFWPWHGTPSTVVLALVEFESGDLGLYEGIWKGPGPWAVSVTTEQRRWELRPLERARFQGAGERHLTEMPPHEWDERFKPGFRLQAEEVVKALRGEPSQAVSLHSAMQTMHLIHSLFDTARSS